MMESVVKLVSVAATVIVSLGGFEFVKWVVTRKYGKRVDEAEADKSEFGALREQVLFLQEQLLKKRRGLRSRKMSFARRPGASLTSCVR